MNLVALQAIDDALDAFMFKESDMFLRGEPWAPTYKKNKPHFKSIISGLVSFKRDVRKYYVDQSKHMWKLVNLNVLRAGVTQKEYFLEPYWEDDAQVLAQTIHKHTSGFFNLGAAAVGAGLLLDLSKNADIQKALTDHAITAAGQINQTTQDRITAAIKTSIELGEDRSQLEDRLLDVFDTPYRGMLTAKQEGMQAYMDGKDESANEQEMTKKTWVGPQATDEICGDTDGETVGIDELFSNGLDGPLAHFGCLCDVEYS